MVVQEFESNEIVSRDGVNSRISDINSIVPVVIYDDNNGTNDHIDFTSKLTELGISSLVEFEYLEFYFSNDEEDTSKAKKDDGMSCSKVYKWEENGTRFNNTINLELNAGIRGTNTNSYKIYSTRYSIGTTEENKNKAIRDTSKSLTLSFNNSGDCSLTRGAHILVYRVVGYKH